jgi:hypothetical protein
MTALLYREETYYEKAMSIPDHFGIPRHGSRLRAGGRNLSGKPTALIPHSAGEFPNRVRSYAQRLQ